MVKFSEVEEYINKIAKNFGKTDFCWAEFSFTNFDVKYYIWHHPFDFREEEVEGIGVRLYNDPTGGECEIYHDLDDYNTYQEMVQAAFSDECTDALYEEAITKLNNKIKLLKEQKEKLHNRKED